MMKRAFLICKAPASQFLGYLILSLIKVEMYKFQAPFPVLPLQDVQSSISLGPTASKRDVI